MKKTLTFKACGYLVCFLMLFIVTACNNQWNTSPTVTTNCQHAEVIDPAIDSSCEKTGLTEGKHCSICSEIIVAQEVIPTKVHLYENVTCTVCGYTADHSEYFNFIPLKSGGYAIAGLKSSEDYPSELLIPSMHEGAPVTTVQFLIPSILNNATPSLAWEFEGPTERIESVVIPNGVTIIEEGAFAGLEGLSRITISDSVTFIGKNAFEACEALTAVYINDLTKWCELEIDYSGVSYGSPYSVGSPFGYALYCNGELVTNLIIPDEVTSINCLTFFGCNSIKNVTLTSNVTSIGSFAFQGCDNLKSIEIPGNVKSVGSGAFAHCSSLESVVLCKGFEEIGEYAFRSCENLTNITIPDSVKFIGIGVFEDTSKLISLTYGGTVSQWKTIHLASNLIYGDWKNSASFVRIICSDDVIWIEDIS